MPVTRCVISSFQHLLLHRIPVTSELFGCFPAHAQVKTTLGYETDNAPEPGLRRSGRLLWDLDSALLAALLLGKLFSGCQLPGYETAYLNLDAIRVSASNFKILRNRI